ncbi:MAG TPA: DUF167 domain-containing protein [Fimbriimonas sp.]|nr:DUF167 domain-containing protein [Fimbriimonas sp.]
MLNLSIRVTARAGKNAVVLQGEVVKVWVTSAPTDGQANEAVIKALAKALGLAPSKLAIIRGGTSREKVVKVEELTLEEALARLREAQK